MLQDPINRRPQPLALIAQLGAEARVRRWRHVFERKMCRQRKEIVLDGRVWWVS